MENAAAPGKAQTTAAPAVSLGELEEFTRCLEWESVDVSLDDKDSNTSAMFRDGEGFGFNAGFIAGHSLGLKQGTSSGYSAGVEAARSAAHRAAEAFCQARCEEIKRANYTAGYNQAKADYYDARYVEGWLEGQQLAADNEAAAAADDDDGEDDASSAMSDESASSASTSNTCNSVSSCDSTT